MCPVCLQQFIATRADDPGVIPLTALPAIDARPDTPPPALPAAEPVSLEPQHPHRCCCGFGGGWDSSGSQLTHPMTSQFCVRGMSTDYTLQWIPADRVVGHDVSYEEQNLPSEPGPIGAGGKEVCWVSVASPAGQFSVRSDDLQLARDLQRVSVHSLPQQSSKLKIRYVRHRLQSLLHPAGASADAVTIRLELRRHQMAADLQFFFLAMSPADFSRELRFRLKNETDFFQDVGGVTREIFSQVIRELFANDLGLFTPVQNGVDGGCYRINPQPPKLLDQAALERYQFAGRLTGKALLDGHTLPVPLASALYLQMLRKPVGMLELQALDEQMYNSLVWMLQNDVADVDETFTITEAGPLGVVERELCKEGKQLAVTELNKGDFVEMRVAWELSRRVEGQLQAFLQGVWDVVPDFPAIAGSLTADELRLLCCGAPEIDVDEWQASTLYSAPCTQSDPVIQWFWSAVRKMKHDTRARLLQFVTGSSCVPVEGFLGLASVHGKCYPFSISTIPMARTGWSLPRAHTCFNRLDLPKYTSQQELESNLMRVLEEDSMGFGMDE